MSNNSEQGIFINGKQQIIEMLQFMNEKDRQKLLNNIKQRNAVMARELSEQSFSFKDLFQLSSDNLRKIFTRTNPAIIGLALYPLDANHQRKALAALDRNIAEEAFGIMNQDLSGKKHECKRAQEKIVTMAIQLSRQDHIHI
ncbi:MAG: flagellar motor switch protein FliG [Bacteriovoracaceae bacterium]|jgi:flagellar motor switch protein FliG